MSRAADLRDELEKIAGMFPLSKRELEIAAMIFQDGDLADIREDPQWYGEASLAVAEAIFGSDALPDSETP